MQGTMKARFCPQVNNLCIVAVWLLMHLLKPGREVIGSRLYSAETCYKVGQGLVRTVSANNIDIMDLNSHHLESSTNHYAAGIYQHSATGMIRTEPNAAGAARLLSIWLMQL